MECDSLTLIDLIGWIIAGFIVIFRGPFQVATARAKAERVRSALELSNAERERLLRNVAVLKTRVDALDPDTNLRYGEDEPEIPW